MLPGHIAECVSALTLDNERARMHCEVIDIGLITMILPAV